MLYIYYYLVILEIQGFYNQIMDSKDTKDSQVRNGANSAASVTYAIQGINPITMLKDIRTQMDILTFRNKEQYFRQMQYILSMLDINGVSEFITQPSKNSDEFPKLTDKEQWWINSILKATVGDYGDLLDEEQHVCKTLLKIMKATKYIVEPYEIMKQANNIRYAGNYDADKFAKEIRRLKAMADRVNYPLNDEALTEQILQGLRGPMTQVRTVVNMIPNQRKLDNVLEMIENHYQTVVDSRRVNHFKQSKHKYHKKQDEEEPEEASSTQKKKPYKNSKFVSRRQ